MMTPAERTKALTAMRAASTAFYAAAVRIGNHPFIEFTGLMNEYIKACETAHDKGIDFSECNTHSGVPLPMAPYMVAYVNEKLECIFTGRSVMSHEVSCTCDDAHGDQGEGCVSLPHQSTCPKAVTS